MIRLFVGAIHKGRGANGMCALVLTTESGQRKNNRLRPKHHRGRIENSNACSLCQSGWRENKISRLATHKRRIQYPTLQNYPICARCEKKEAQEGGREKNTKSLRIGTFRMLSAQACQDPVWFEGPEL